MNTRFIRLTYYNNEKNVPTNKKFWLAVDKIVKVTEFAGCTHILLTTGKIEYVTESVDDIFKPMGLTEVEYE